LKGTTLTYWMVRVYADDANSAVQKAMRDWGRQNGVDAKLELVTGTELPLKLSAAIASGTFPDVVDLPEENLKIFSDQGVFLPVTDLVNQIGSEHGGWYPAATEAGNVGTDETPLFTGVPYGLYGNLLLYRKDKLQQAGISSPPDTWQDLVADGAKVNNPPYFAALGLALSNNDDANVQISALESFGGRIADKAGKVVTIKSPETRAYLEWVKDAWDKKEFAPGVTTWDGAGDNQAYLSGQAAFIANTGSVGQAARKDDPDLFKNTGYAPLPTGAHGRFSPVSVIERAIPKAAKNPDGARSLIAYLMRNEASNAFYANAIYGPVLKDETSWAAFTSDNPVLTGLADLSKYGCPPAFGEVNNSAFNELRSSFIVPKMVQRVVVDGWSIDRAMDEAQTQGQMIYDKKR
jgi:multiple sugar transport system substrate-binding protein